MTIEWKYTDHGHVGVLTLTGHLGMEAIDRFVGAVGWTLARGSGPVIVDLTGLLGWSPGGQLAVADAARRLAGAGRRLELAAIPADGSLVPSGTGPEIPVHPDLAAALAAHGPAVLPGPRQDGPVARRPVG
ncbi:anti-sigma factor antagonist [Streptomyces bambusae]|uniref:anti-sigma factor antagonist n=1 Tax=Streptomyces bambusae TaxID=1550616 RepID=UPI001CFDF9BE|nr:anti-sigma factor antagonist [Streptomyces bambusae]MCB5163927.1 anti-sigma factor antagonist [Streptomyces bambusae]